MYEPQKSYMRAGEAQKVLGLSPWKFKQLVDTRQIEYIYQPGSRHKLYCIYSYIAKQKAARSAESTAMELSVLASALANGAPLVIEPAIHAMANTSAILEVLGRKA